MNTFINIAIIDSGIISTYLKKPLKHNIVIDDNYQCLNVKKYIDSEIQSFYHGTICGLIIEKYCKSYSLSSIKILDKENKGFVDKLQLALDWCYKNGIYLINLSLGSVYFKDKKTLQALINHYSNKKMIIVAASSNDKYITYPASFSNVIGIAAGKGLNVMQNLKGIDFKALSTHSIIIDSFSFITNNSNSYAAPYVTALIANILLKKSYMNLNWIRKKLYDYNNYNNFTNIINLYPDWIEYAYIDSFSKISHANYYFHYISLDFEQCKDFIDTIITTNEKKINYYRRYNKNIIYLGNKKIPLFNSNSYYWDKNYLIKRILSIPLKAENLNIPIVLCNIEPKCDFFLYLTTIQNFFNADNYNIYIMCFNIISILFNFEYFPHDFFRFDCKNIFLNYLYWQTFYQQSDIILIATSNNIPQNLYNYLEIDITISIKQKDIFTQVLFQWNKISERVIYSNKETEIIYDIYNKILGLLTEENNE